MLSLGRIVISDLVSPISSCKPFTFRFGSTLLGHAIFTLKVSLHEILITYVRQQEAVFEYLRGKQLHLSGDICCDSPGYSAKYSTYTIMDSATDLILDYSLVAMEKEGLQCCLDKLLTQDVNHFHSYR